MYEYFYYFYLYAFEWSLMLKERKKRGTRNACSHTFSSFLSPSLLLPFSSISLAARPLVRPSRTLAAPDSATARAMGRSKAVERAEAALRASAAAKGSDEALLTAARHRLGAGTRRGMGRRRTRAEGSGVQGGGRKAKARR